MKIVLGREISRILAPIKKITILGVPNSNFPYGKKRISGLTNRIVHIEPTNFFCCLSKNLVLKVTKPLMNQQKT